MSSPHAIGDTGAWACRTPSCICFRQGFLEGWEGWWGVKDREFPVEPFLPNRSRDHMSAGLCPLYLGVPTFHRRYTCAHKEPTASFNEG